MAAPPTASAPAPTWTEPTACTLGLTAPERMLFPTDVGGLSVAAIGQTALFVYHDDRFVLRARTYDLAKHVVGKEIVLDDKGEGIRVDVARPLAPAPALPDLANPQASFWLLAADRPLLTYDDGSIAPLDWEGAELSPSRRGALYTDGTAWTTVDGQPWLFWNDYRSGDAQAYGAPVGCGGTVPETKEPAPIVTTHASAPPPKARACSLKLASDARAVSAKALPPRTHHLSAHGSELWVDWGTESAGPSGLRESLYLRRFARAGTPLGPAQLLRDNPSDPVMLVEGGESFISAKDGHAFVTKIRPDGKPDDASQVDLGVPFDTWTGTALAARDGGDLFWLAGKRGVFQSRAYAKDKPGPLVAPQTPDRDVSRFRVLERPDGWIAAWRTSDSLVVERSVNGTLAWAARIPAPKVPGRSPLALDVVGDQIVVLTSDDKTARLVRFQLDGARLDDSALTLPNQVLAASVSAHGVAAVTDDACLHLIGFDGKPLASPSCKKPADPGARLGSDDIVDPLVWSGDIAAWAYGGMGGDVYLRRWTCD